MSSLDRVVPHMRTRTNILLIEAKRMDPKEDIIAKSLPQVLAQAHLRYEAVTTHASQTDNY